MRLEPAFDAYYKWLGIPPEEQPPNHYRLLGIPLFEADPDVIDATSCRQMAHLRTYQLGKHVALSQKLLNDVAAARVCLLDPQKKAVYDAMLHEHLALESHAKALQAMGWQGEFQRSESPLGYGPPPPLPAVPAPVAPVCPPPCNEPSFAVPVGLPVRTRPHRMPKKRLSNAALLSAFSVLLASVLLLVLAEFYGLPHPPQKPRGKSQVTREDVAKTLAMQLHRLGFGDAVLTIHWLPEPTVQLNGNVVLADLLKEMQNSRDGEGQSDLRIPRAVIDACRTLRSRAAQGASIELVIGFRRAAAQGRPGAGDYDSLLGPPLTRWLQSLSEDLPRASFDGAYSQVRIP
jgi:hypothetical protein